MTRGVQEAKLGNVIDRFYEAAAQPALWRTVLHEASIALGAEGAELFPGPQARVRPVYSEPLDEAIATGLSEGWFADNPRVTRGLAALDTGAVITESMIFSPEELDRLPFNAEFVNRFGFQGFAALSLTSVGPSGVFLSVERRREQGIFSHREIALLGSMAPHLRRAVQVALQLSEARATGMLDCLDVMNCGGILLDALGNAMRLNAPARRHLGRGLALTHGQLTAGHRKANAALQRLIGSVLQPVPAHEAPARGAVAIPRPNRRPLIVHAAPVVGSARDVFQRAKAILTVVDPDEHPEPSEPVLSQAFGLSRSEVRVALELLKGQELKDIAHAHGTTLGTVRTQLKSIYAKTETHRQAELVALLGRMAPPMH